jgi:glyoxylase-like metal-dependent hydrolase (beta-lactamase superfamily II)
MSVWRWAAGVGIALGLLCGVGLMFAPYVFNELFDVSLALHFNPLPAPLPGFAHPPKGPLAGMDMDGHWRAQRIAPDTYALGEPAEDPDNYEYLLVGRTRALLIDGGATRRDIRPVVARLTSLPVTVIPTHLHFDHTVGLRNLTSIALIDLPETRSRVRDGKVYLSHAEFLGEDPPVLAVSDWVKPDGVFDLGGRQVKVLWTPGHTATSISLWDGTNHLLFTGDYLYPTSLFVFTPDASLSAYQATADRLLAMAPPDTRLYGAHCCRNDVPPQAPWLTLADLRDVRAAVIAIRSEKARGRGFIIRRFPVNSRMTLLTLYPFGNQ